MSRFNKLRANLRIIYIIFRHFFFLFYVFFSIRYVDSLPMLILNINLLKLLLNNLFERQLRIKKKDQISF